MKKIIYLLLLLPLLTVLGGCNDKEEIVFDHELPQFAIKDNAILLEVIMPSGSAAEDEYYIYGPFNGGEEAIGNPEWQLEKAAGNDKKWGIYLAPGSFQAGKTLADGFTFYSKRQGAERTVNNEPVQHTLSTGPGTRTNVWVSRWEAYFGGVEKNSYSVYVVDNTGWDALALYAWGDDGDMTPAWPGLLPTGTETIGEYNFTVFDMGEELKGATLNIIFNNNNGGKQIDGPQAHALNQDLYLVLTDGNYELIDPNVPSYKGYTVYVDNQTGWDALALYGWGADGDVTPGWPGLLPTGEKEINGVLYTLFQWGEALNGQTANMIFNNNNNGKQFDAMAFTIERDLYVRITEGRCEEVDPHGTPYNGKTIYVNNQSGWEELAIHYYGDAESQWPGVRPNGTRDINGVTYTYFEMPEDMNDKSINIIFNNNGAGAQFDGPYITLDRDHYLHITDGACQEVDPNATPGFKLYIEDNTGWDALALHYWGDGVEGTAWPGLQPAGTKEMAGLTFTCFELPAALNGKSISTIFNNNNNGAQFDGPYIAIDRDYYLRITAGTAEEIVSTIYVKDETGWDALALYAWGDAEFAGWPGLQPAGTKDVNGTIYTYFEPGAAMTGKNVNLIFNNNNAGSQLGDINVTLVRDFYFVITPEGHTEVNQ